MAGTVGRTHGGISSGRGVTLRLPHPARLEQDQKRAGAGTTTDPDPPALSAASGAPIGTTSPGGTRSLVLPGRIAEPVQWPRAPSGVYAEVRQEEGPGTCPNGSETGQDYGLSSTVPGRREMESTGSRSRWDRRRSQRPTLGRHGPRVEPLSLVGMSVSRPSILTPGCHKGRSQQPQSEPGDEGVSPGRPGPSGERHLQPLSTLSEASQQPGSGQQRHRRHHIHQRQPVSWANRNQDRPPQGLLARQTGSRQAPSSFRTRAATSAQSSIWCGNAGRRLAGRPR
jgi:hypothetical protein